MRRGDSDVNFGQSGPGDLNRIFKIDDNISSWICFCICIGEIDDKDKVNGISMSYPVYIKLVQY